jgi:CheY-like chemotaxis protein
MQKQPTAIVVDDSNAFLMYLSVLLKRMNVDVMPVNNAAEALELARVTRPHLMTLDMVMPEMDGVEALREIRADDELADLPVIMISSYQDQGQISEARAMGCIDVLDKPINLRALHAALQSCDLHQGGRRVYLRASYDKSVGLVVDNKVRTLKSVTLSERGIYVSTRDLLRRDTEVGINLPLPRGEILNLKGQVIYTKSQNGSRSLVSQGMAIKFDHLTTRDMELLTETVTELLIGDILAEQQEMIVQAH